MRRLFALRSLFRLKPFGLDAFIAANWTKSIDPMDEIGDLFSILDKLGFSMGIDATKAMQLAKKFFDAKGNYDTVKGVNDTMSKVEKEMKKKPASQDWASILMKRDPTLDKAIKEFQRQTKEAKYLVKTKIDWPKDNTEKLLSEATKAARKGGVDNKRTKKIISDLEDDLNKRNLMLALCMRSAKIQGKRCEERIKTVRATKKYLKVLESYFMTVTSMGISSGSQVLAFSMARQCLEAYGEAGNLEKALLKLKVTYGEFYRHSAKLNDQVENWISVAGSDGLKHEIEERLR